MMEQDDKREIWNNTVTAILVPPNRCNPHQSWKACVYSSINPGRVYFGTRCLPGKILQPCTELIRDKKSIMGFLVQITNADQYIYLRSAGGKVLAFEVYSGETSIIQDLSQDKEIIIAGEVEKPKLAGPTYLIEVTFSMHEIKDQGIVDRVVDTAWKGKV